MGAVREVGTGAIHHSFAGKRVRAIHYAALHRLQVIVGLCLDTRRLHEREEYVETDLELAVADFGEPRVVRRQNLPRPVADAVAQTAHAAHLVVVFVACVVTNVLTAFLLVDDVGFLNRCCALLCLVVAAFAE